MIRKTVLLMTKMLSKMRVALSKTVSKEIMKTLSKVMRMTLSKMVRMTLGKMVSKTVRITRNTVLPHQEKTMTKTLRKTAMMMMRKMMMMNRRKNREDVQDIDHHVLHLQTCPAAATIGNLLRDKLYLVKNLKFSTTTTQAWRRILIKPKVISL